MQHQNTDQPDFYFQTCQETTQCQGPNLPVSLMDVTPLMTGYATQLPIPSRDNFKKMMDDQAFVDYFNVFLLQPIFSRRLCYKFFSKKFVLDPPVDSRYLVVVTDKAMEWCRRVRFPIFSKTQLFLEYYLCCHLRQPLSVRDPPFLIHKAIATCEEWWIFVDHAIGFLLGMRHFRKSMHDTPGEKLYQLWLDLERFSQLGLSDPRRNILYLYIREKYMMAESKAHLKFSLLPADLHERSSIQKLIESSYIHDDCDVSRSAPFSGLQTAVARCLQNYWLPRHLIDLLASSTIDLSAIFTPTQRDAFMAAISDAATMFRSSSILSDLSKEKRSIARHAWKIAIEYIINVNRKKLSEQEIKGKSEGRDEKTADEKGKIPEEEEEEEESSLLKREQNTVMLNNDTMPKVISPFKGTTGKKLTKSIQSLLKSDVDTMGKLALRNPYPNDLIKLATTSGLPMSFSEFQRKRKLGEERMAAINELYECIHTHLRQFPSEEDEEDECDDDNDDGGDDDDRPLINEFNHDSPDHWMTCSTISNHLFTSPGSLSLIDGFDKRWGMDDTPVFLGYHSQNPSIATLTRALTTPVRRFINGGNAGCNILTLEKHNIKLMVQLTSDLLAGSPFTEYLKRNGATSVVDTLNFWHALMDYRHFTKEDHRSTTDSDRRAREIVELFLLSNSPYKLCFSEKLLHSLYTAILYDMNSPAFNHAQKMCFEILSPAIHDFCTQDHREFPMAVFQRVEKVEREEPRANLTKKESVVKKVATVKFDEKSSCANNDSEQESQTISETADSEDTYVEFKANAWGFQLLLDQQDSELSDGGEISYTTESDSLEYKTETESNVNRNARVRPAQSARELDTRPGVDSILPFSSVPELRKLRTDFDKDEFSNVGVDLTDKISDGSALSEMQLILKQDLTDHHKMWALEMAITCVTNRYEDHLMTYKDLARVKFSDLGSMDKDLIDGTQDALELMKKKPAGMSHTQLWEILNKQQKLNIAEVRVDPRSLYVRPMVPPRSKISESGSVDTATLAALMVPLISDEAKTELNKKNSLLPRPISLAQCLNDKMYFESFFKYLSKHNSTVPLKFIVTVQEMKEAHDPKQQLILMKRITRTYLHKRTNPPGRLQCNDDIIRMVPTIANPTPAIVVSAQQAVYRSLDKKWFTKYQNLFEETEEEALTSGMVSKTVSDEDNMANKYMAQVIPWFLQQRKTDALQTTTKVLWRRFTQQLSDFAHGMLYNWHLLRLFYLFLRTEVRRVSLEQTHVQLKGRNPSARDRFASDNGIFPDVPVIINNKSIILNKVVQDTEFWIEVRKYKAMFNAITTGRGKMNVFSISEEYLYLRKKGAAIVTCFLQSEVNPRVRINISPDLCTATINLFENDQLHPSHFHDAYMSVFPYVLQYWCRFMNAWSPISSSKPKLRELYRVKLAEFGKTRVNVSPHGSVGVPDYMAGESLKKRSSEESRIEFSLQNGVVVYQSRENPFLRTIAARRMTIFMQSRISAAPLVNRESPMSRRFGSVHRSSRKNGSSLWSSDQSQHIIGRSTRNKSSDMSMPATQCRVSIGEKTRTQNVDHWISRGGKGFLPPPVSGSALPTRSNTPSDETETESSSGSTGRLTTRPTDVHETLSGMIRHIGVRLYGSETPRHVVVPP